MPTDEIADQIAALPIQWGRNGKMRVLMVTSRDTGRWVMPKGWTMDGKKPWAAAEIEALEEAGAEGFISREELGTYHYLKTMDDGTEIMCRVRLYPMVVERLRRRWKERDERKRRWFTPRGAARRVNEPELSALLLALSKKPLRRSVKAALKRAS